MVYVISRSIIHTASHLVFVFIFVHVCPSLLVGWWIWSHPTSPLKALCWVPTPKSWQNLYRRLGEIYSKRRRSDKTQGKHLLIPSLWSSSVSVAHTFPWDLQEVHCEDFFAGVTFSQPELHRKQPRLASHAPCIGVVPEGATGPNASIAWLKRLPSWNWSIVS